MALWLVRAGKHGEYEKRFLDEGRVYCTCNDFNHSLGEVPHRTGYRKESR